MYPVIIETNLKITHFEKNVSKNLKITSATTCISRRFRESKQKYGLHPSLSITQILGTLIQQIG